MNTFTKVALALLVAGLMAAIITLALVEKKEDEGASSKTLSQAASGLGVYFGAAMNYKKSRAVDDDTLTAYNSTFNRHYTSMTSENECKVAQMVFGPSINDQDIRTDICIEMKNY